MRLMPREAARGGQSRQHQVRVRQRQANIRPGHRGAVCRQVVPKLPNHAAPCCRHALPALRVWRGQHAAVAGAVRPGCQGRDAQVRVPEDAAFLWRQGQQHGQGACLPPSACLPTLLTLTTRVKSQMFRTWRDITDRADTTSRHKTHAYVLSP